MAYEYDPHLLYHSINITVELEYNVPLKTVYRIVEENEKKPKEERLSMQELIVLIRKLGQSLQTKVLNQDESEQDEEIDLKTKIKLMLELLHCELSNEELNKILRGELALEDALNKEARVAWKLFFEKNNKGKMVPNKTAVNQMLALTENFAFMDVNQQYKRELASRTKARMMQVNNVYNSKDNLKTERARKEIIERSGDEKLILLDKQRKKLKLYIAHMQGYDRDRDGDGGRGINMETGEIVDFDDIYMADKGLDEYLRSEIDRQS